MSSKLYVGNLGNDITDADLAAAFAPHGVVSGARVVLDRGHMRSKGFGFVEMETDAGAVAAMAALDGKENAGRTWKVNEARSRILPMPGREPIVTTAAPVPTAAATCAAEPAKAASEEPRMPW